MMASTTVFVVEPGVTALGMNFFYRIAGSPGTEKMTKNSIISKGMDKERLLVSDLVSFIFSYYTLFIFLINCIRIL